ncbi:hypothetical protein KP509_32G064400 [Ceratopteris richardii]|uniref:CCHC-type domain-containing protein n=1 Tax=Ceratopteris richardii TaxID=49495 RepID=A0A8T2QUE7_CERRI|nr:hypothetical protein KP509_32G064400 [Ceratopteris richardii]
MGDNIAQIVGDKLNKDNYHICSDRMENLLMGKGLWGLVNGEDECLELPENPNAEEQKEYKTWIEKTRKVLHWISICISESLIPHIMKASTPKEASDIIHKIYGTSTEDRKIHLKQKLHSVWCGNRNITNDLASINCTVDDDDMYKSLDTSILVRGTMSDVDELEVVVDMPRGRARTYSRGRGRSQALGNCYHCGKYGHFEKDCYYKQNSQRGRGRSYYEAHGNFSAESSYRDYGRDNMFAMEHVLNSMSKPGNDMNWYIDFRCTNHMTRTSRRNFKHEESQGYGSYEFPTPKMSWSENAKNYARRKEKGKDTYMSD